MFPTSTLDIIHFLVSQMLTFKLSTEEPGHKDWILTQRCQFIFRLFFLQQGKSMQVVQACLYSDWCRDGKTWPRSSNSIFYFDARRLRKQRLQKRLKVFITMTTFIIITISNRLRSLVQLRIIVVIFPITVTYRFTLCGRYSMLTARYKLMYRYVIQSK